MFLDSIIFKKSKNGDNKVFPRSEILGNLKFGSQGGFLMGCPGGDDRRVFITSWMLRPMWLEGVPVVNSRSIYLHIVTFFILNTV